MSTTVEPVANGQPFTLATKNRKAQELRQQAIAIRDELLDASKPMTADEVRQKQDAMNALHARANVIAEFTADAEIDRQGGTGSEVTAVVGPENRSDTRLQTRKGRMKMQDRINDLAERIGGESQDVRHFLSVAVAGTNPIENDKQRKLVDEARVLTRAIIGTAGDVSGGEFVLPLTQVQSIFSLANIQQGLLQRARSYNVPGRTLRIPYLAQTDDGQSWTTNNRPMAGQIANVGIVGEGSTKPIRQPVFGQRLLTVFKYAAITQVSDELLSDDFTGELPTEFVNAVGQQALNAVNEDITISGSDVSGATTPAGALRPSSPYNIAVTRQTAGTITTQDLFAMYAQHTHGPNSVWLASRRTIQAIYALSLTAGSMVTFLRDLRGLPEMMILGYPLVLTDILNTLGTAGDLALVNPDFYAFALRQALTVESSRDFAFIQDLTTYRFVARAGGIPTNTGWYAYKYGTTSGIDEHSPFVYLA